MGLNAQPEERSDFGILVNSGSVPTEPAPIENEAADEDWGHCISEFSTLPSNIRNGKACLYDPKIRRYFYRLADGTKVITGA